MEDGEGGRWLGHVLTPPLVEAAIMVLTDMGLALLSVVANLMVINSLREKEALLGVKQNLVRQETKDGFCHSQKLLSRNMSFH